jgi:hypothetical protein
MSSERQIALKKEIDELKKSQGTVEKDAGKAIKTLLASDKTPEVKRAETHTLKKEMKASLIRMKNELREKKKEARSIQA